ncbi:MAG: putative hydrolase or acyltransferase of alpha/beta superfamily [Planctomycetota bacterium]|nr:putative hydrolase or acyltransferase of alpha/beta superfamily [Planctomycetota bacterium]
MPTFCRDGLNFRYRDIGQGLPVVFQHGLGGDVSIPCGLFSPPEGGRLISCDSRYHGETRPLGDPAKLNFDDIADDLLALLDHLGIDRVVVGGISMGAGLALNFAIRHPERTSGLILSRPAWLEEPFPENVRMFPIMAEFIRRLGWRDGLSAFKQSPTYAGVLRESSDSATALVGMFENPRAEETVEKLDRIPQCCPSPDRDAWRSIAVPTLILANQQDPIHPYAMGQTLAETIPGAELRELTPKCVDIVQHGADVQRHMTDFLLRHFLSGPA